MIKNIGSWAQGVIVAVIIASIIEMILPKSSSSKYIKTVIGVYILYTIISPAIKFITGKEIILNNTEFEKYFNTTNIVADVPASNDIYITELNKKIKEDVEGLGFNVSKVNADLDIEKGELKSISLYIENKDVKGGNIIINKVEIGNTYNEKKLDESEAQRIKDFLSETYNININNIMVNSK